MKCRHCKKELSHVFLDLGFAPPSNSYVSHDALHAPELYFPLRLFVCDDCWLVQTEDYNRADELFSSDYAYFSSVSSSWLAHAKQYADMITQKICLDQNSLVVEVASNDGYLLKNFMAANIPCLGIEPTASTAAAARQLGIPVKEEFFGRAMAEGLRAEGHAADLIIGNNVYAHVPDINDFTAGFKVLLKTGGTVTLEFPHLLQLIVQNQFDTVYHEHYSYLSLQTVQRIFAANGLRVFDVEKLSTHGGSLRVYGCHHDDPRADTARVADVLVEEKNGGLQDVATYTAFQKKAEKVKDDFLAFLIEQKRAGKSVAAYGAAAKGNTLLNFAGVKADLLSFVCDAASSKQGKHMPGSHLPILPPQALNDRTPDYIVILPWNIRQEVAAQLSPLRDKGAHFVVAVPELDVF